MYNLKCDLHIKTWIIQQSMLLQSSDSPGSHKSRTTQCNAIMQGCFVSADPAKLFVVL